MGDERIQVEVWLYGPIARYAGQKSQGSYAQLFCEVKCGSTLRDLLQRLGVPADETGITFINGSLASLPGLTAADKVVLHAGDRIGVSHRKSMWPFQYRFGVHLTEELRDEFRSRPDRGVHHTYTALLGPED
jgi:hypothetical protein